MWVVVAAATVSIAAVAEMMQTAAVWVIAASAAVHYQCRGQPILSLVFARFHAKIITWGHHSQDFVQLGFSGGEEDDYDEEDEEFLYS